MSNLAIKAEQLSKKYRIFQGRKPRYRTLRDTITKTLTQPARALRSRSNGVAVAPAEARPDELWALRDVNFEIHRGEVVGIIGHNGAGKSTLLKILTRITEPTRGSVDLWGRVGSLLEVGTGFHKELTGAENVYLNGAILGMGKTEIERKFDEIVAFAEVEKFIYNPVKYYSSGMTVRLAFAVAAHLEPEILLVDEVLAVGDANFQRKSLAKMEDVGREGRTVLFVSHHMPSIVRLCERTILLKQGEVIADGPTGQVVGDYLSSALGTAAAIHYENPALAPGNEVVRLRSVRVKTAGGESRYSIDIREPVGVEIEYEVLQDGQVLNPYFSLSNNESLILFTSISTDSEWRVRPRPPGRYLSTGWIPGNLLNEGTMMVSVGVRTELPYRNHFFEKEAIAFQVIEPAAGDTARMDNARRYKGVVRPLLEWNTEVISAGLREYHGG